MPTLVLSPQTSMWGLLFPCLLFVSHTEDQGHATREAPFPGTQVRGHSTQMSKRNRSQWLSLQAKAL